MSQAFSKSLLSGSTNGQPILVAATADPGTLIHTAVAGTSSLDEVWLWAHNTDTVDRTVTIEFGGNVTKNLITLNVPHQAGAALVIPGWPLQNGLTVKAYASAANVVAVEGFVNSIV
jgi:hypothetical protein